jgi:phospholipase B1
MNYNTEIPSFIAALHSYNEYRGLSYSIGGNVNASTVPNYIKHFQPNVTGYSIGKHLGEYCNGKLTMNLYFFFS